MSSVPDDQPPGKVFTFYSYKGGVGRSMALVNVGVLLALVNKRVLLVDWDLEAPGLEMYFHGAAKLIGDPRQVPGIVDLLEARVAGTPLDWRQCRLKAEFLGQSLDIISAGSRTSEYRSRVQKLDWESLYNDHRVGNFVNDLREQWRSEYDFILVDSRTGVTDIGDICTVLLPDLLVLMFVSNRQNIEGVKSVAERAVSTRKKLPVNRNKLIFLPLPGRTEWSSEYDQSGEWKEIYAVEFGYLYQEWLPKEVTPADALNKLYVPYVTKWSFGERIPVLESARETQDPTTIGAAYKRLANLMASGLDWYAMEGKASVEDLQGAQIELQRAREQSAILERAAKRARYRSLATAAFAALLTLGFAVSYFYERSRPPDLVPVQSTELFDGRDLFNRGKIAEALKIFEARKLVLEGQLARAPQDKGLLADLDFIYAWIGTTNVQLGRLPEALVAFRVSKQARERILEVTPDDASSLRELSVRHGNIGRILIWQGKLDDALAAFRAEKVILDKLIASKPSDKSWQREVGSYHEGIGSVLALQGKLDDALTASRSEKAIFEKLMGSEPSDADALDLAYAHLNLGSIFQKQDKLSEALASYHSGIAIIEKLTTSDPSKIPLQRGLARFEGRTGEVLIRQGEYAGAETAIERARTTAEGLVALSPANQDLKFIALSQYKRLGMLEHARGHHAKGQAWFEKTEAMLDALIKSDPTNAVWRRDFMELGRLKSDAVLAGGKATEALAPIERSVGLYGATKIEAGADFFWNHEFARDLVQLGRVRAALNDRVGAEKSYNDARTLFNRLVKASPSDAEIAKAKTNLERLTSETRRKLSGGPGKTGADPRDALSKNA